MISKMLFFTKSRILSSEAGFCCHSGRKMLKRVCNTARLCCWMLGRGGGVAWNCRFCCHVCWSSPHQHSHTGKNCVVHWGVPDRRPTKCYFVIHNPPPSPRPNLIFSCCESSSRQQAGGGEAGEGRNWQVARRVQRMTQCYFLHSLAEYSAA